MKNKTNYNPNYKTDYDTKYKTNYKNNILGWIFNLPYLIYSLVFFLIPLIWAFWLSTTDWNLMSPKINFVWFQNFAKVFTDNKLKAAFFNSFKYLIIIVILTLICALITALLVHNLPDKIKGIVAVLFFIPYLTSGVATAVVVKYLLNYNSAFNEFLRNF